MSSGDRFHEILGKPQRRWFSSRQFDLILWLDQDQAFDGFELCYDKNDDEHSIAWSRAFGFRHMAVDNGEGRPGKHKAAPLLVADGAFDRQRVLDGFLAVSTSLPQDVVRFVVSALAAYPL